MQTICMEGQCLKNLPVDGFKWKQNDGDFIKDYDEDIDIDYFTID